MARYGGYAPTDRERTHTDAQDVALMAAFVGARGDVSLCMELTPREAISCYGRGSDEHHDAIAHAARCGKVHA